MKFSLAAMIRRIRTPRRKQIPIREIAPPATLATDLFRAFYLPFVETWVGRTDRIVVEYERTLSVMTQDSPVDLEGELGFVDRELSRLLVLLTPRLRDWATRVERFHRGKWRGAVLSASGVDLQTMIGPEDVAETVEALIARNVGLVTDISSQARGRIADSVFRGLTNRTPAREVAAEIREAVGGARRRALAVASDQLTKATSALDSERMRQAGIEAWIWKWSHKLHGRPEHIARDGKEYTFADPPPEMPGQLPWCGCRKQGLIRFD